MMESGTNFLITHSSSSHTCGAKSFGWNKIVLLFFIHSQGAKKTFLFPTVTGHFVKLNSLPEKPPTDYICTIEQVIIILCGRTSKHLHDYRNGSKTFVYQKVC